MEEAGNNSERESQPIFIPKDELIELLESEEYQAAMRQTFETRARVGSVMGRFFMNTRAGRYLLRTKLFTHPIIREKELQEERIKKRAEQLEAISPHLNKNAAELMVRIEPDFRPRDSVQVILETRIDDLAFYKRISKQDYDPNCDIDYCFKISAEEAYARLGQLGPEQASQLNERFPDILEGRKISHIQERFYQLLTDRDWNGFLDLVVTHYKQAGVGVTIACWIFEHQQYIFSNQHFRAALFKRLMTILIREGENSFRRFDKLWWDVGMDMREDDEKKELAKTVFPHELWLGLMNENPNRYFEYQELLNSYGICP